MGHGLDSQALTTRLNNIKHKRSLSFHCGSLDDCGSNIIREVEVHITHSYHMITVSNVNFYFSNDVIFFVCFLSIYRSLNSHLVKVSVHV